MTETEWLGATDLESMLYFLRDKASDRKLRLFFCACCRCKQYPLCPQGSAAVEVAEKVADGLVDKLVRADSERHIQSLIPSEGDWSPYSLIFWALRAEKWSSYPLDYVMMWAIPNVVQACLASNEEVASILQDLFGNPFRPVAVEPEWLTSTVVALAQGIYDEKAFDRLPVLADALMDAGCTHESILNHCRSEGPHVKGCWVVDLILGKT